MNRVLVLGNGFLGKQYAKNGYTVWGRDKFNVDPDHVYDSVYDQLTSEALKDFDVVINCIGNANTRECEDPAYWEVVHAINAELPTQLSNLCSGLGKQFVQISSGCVYDKNNEPQHEDSYISSHCRYVVSKLAGEFGCSRHDLILRPRLYFGEDVDKNNLLCKIQNFDTFLTDINSYTSVQTIVEATTALLQNDCGGVFNVSQTGYCNLVDIARILDVDVDDTITGEQLRDMEGLYLVNNIMDTSKLEQFYKPKSIFDEIKCTWGLLKPKLV